MRLICKEVGEYVEQDEEITSIETDKVLMTVFWMLTWGD
jgi:pyruvate/2-oxoglutarate dehydrogenase complex dihydrolipoamide acyltransferase (E2) component